MPRHPRTLQHTNRITCIIKHILEIHHPRIIIILSREQRLAEIRRMAIGTGVVVGVPAAETEVEAADAGVVVVNDDDFFVVGPELDGVCVWGKGRGVSGVGRRRREEGEDKDLWSQRGRGGGGRRCWGASPRGSSASYISKRPKSETSTVRTLVCFELIDIVCVTSLYTITYTFTPSSAFLFNSRSSLHSG